VSRTGPAFLILWLAAVVVRAPIRATAVTPRWQVSGEGRGTPALSAAAAYFLTRSHDVVAVDARTGRVRWKGSTGEPGDETLGSSVVAAGKSVVAGDYTLIGLDADTGARRWRFEPPEGYGAGLYLGDTLGGDVFAGSPAGRLYSVGTLDGRLRWSAIVKAEPKTTVFQPAAQGDSVAAGYTTFGPVTSGGVLLVDRRTGQALWHKEFPPLAPGAPTGFGGGPVILEAMVLAASGDGTIYALDRATGATIWSLPPAVRPDGRRQDRDWRALAAGGDTLVAGSVSGTITAFDMRARTQKWRFSHPDGGSTGVRITVQDDVVYVPHLGGLLVSLDLEDGHLRWQTGGFADGFSWAPAVEGGNVYAAASRAGLFALPR
jgi:outer membrane protein assembly factor BamB